ncbi:hypothetical protein ABW17_23045, partial [Mycobacterium nebraskense]
DHRTTRRPVRPASYQPAHPTTAVESRYRRIAPVGGHYISAVLEPLGADEPGATVDVGQDVDAIIDVFLHDAGWSVRKACDDRS